MTKPKEHHPGQVVELNRRTTQRQFFWLPGKDTRNLFGYMYGKAANDHGQIPHGACLMSNHPHLLQTDTTGLRSDFMRQLFSNSARKRNLELNRRENIWASGPPGDMVILDLEKLIEKLLYVWLQAVAAGCVEKVEDWTGFQILPKHWGKPMRFPRPERCGEDMPEFVEIVPQPPPGFEHLPLEQTRAFFENLIKREEARYAKLRTRPVLGIEVCEALSVFQAPRTDAPMGSLNPRFCTRDPLRLARALQRLRQFRAQHRACSIGFRDGNRDIVFPAGTIQMVRVSGVACLSSDPTHPLHTDSTWTRGVRAMWDDWLARVAA